jgi:heme-degrading monooxygenase HmoA
MHVAAETEDGFLVVDVFESQEAFDKFRAIASPIATEAGIEEPPKSYPLHTYVSV